MNRQLEHIMQRRMDRKEFLATIGLAMASVMGFSSIIRLLGGNTQSMSSSKSKSGYGSSPYGR